MGKQRVTGGDLNVRLWRTGDDEVGQLGRAFNDMAQELREKMARLDAETSRLAAVLNNMVSIRSQPMALFWLATRSATEGMSARS